LVHDLEGSDLLEPLEPHGLPPSALVARGRHRRTWPLGVVVLVLVVIASAVSVTHQLRAAELDRLERQWIEVQVRSRARIDTEATLLRFVDLAPDRAVNSALIDTYGNEISFVEQLDRELRGEWIVDHGLSVLRGAMRMAVDLHLSELQAVESYYWAPGPPSQRPPEASRAFLVQSAEVSRQLAEQRQRLGRH
jgi:hypothetical protein